MDIKLILDEFNKYTENFDLNNPYVKAKIKHSYNVMKQSKELAERLNLDEKSILLSTIIGLLHDIGRFEQVKKYKTNKDYKVDHAILGVKALFDNKLIDKLNIPIKYHGVIRFAIENHNKLDIQRENNSDKIFFTQILRDSNEIDILRYSTRKSYMENRKFDIYSRISDKVSRLFFENTVISNFDVVNSNEAALAKFSYIFDMNFSESLRIINEEEILDCYLNRVYTEEIFKPYLKHAKEYIYKKIK